MNGASRRSVGRQRQRIDRRRGWKLVDGRAEGRAPDESRRLGRRQPRRAISDWTCEIINDGNARDRKVPGVFVLRPCLPLSSRPKPRSFMRSALEGPALGLAIRQSLQPRLLSSLPPKTLSSRPKPRGFMRGALERPASWQPQLCHLDRSIAAFCDAQRRDPHSSAPSRMRRASSLPCLFRSGSFA